MKVLVTCKPLKEKKALEEILSLLFQLDPSSKLDEIQIKPGLFSVETNAKKEDIIKITIKFRRSYVKKIIPIDLITDNLLDALILLKKINKKSSIAVRCSSRFGIKGKDVEIQIGNLAKQEGLKINLENPDYVLLVEPIRNLFYLSLLPFLHYKILTDRKSL